MQSLRPMNLSQREFLQSQLQARPTGKLQRLVMHFFEFLVTTFFAGGSAAFFATIVVGPLALLWKNFSGNSDFEIQPLLQFTIIVAVCIVALFAALMVVSEVRSAKALEEGLHPRILTDLAKGEILEENFKTAGVKLFQESEHKAFLFFIHLSNGKTLVLYDHGSFDEQGDRSWDEPPTMEVRETLSRVTFPVSKLGLWDFSGELLPLPPKLAMTDDPKKWPEDESWCRVKWENIERHYGLKQKPRQAAASRRS